MFVEGLLYAKHCSPGDDPGQAGVTADPTLRRELLAEGLRGRPLGVYRTLRARERGLCFPLMDLRQLYPIGPVVTEGPLRVG